MDWSKPLKNLRKHLEQYIEVNSIKTLVLGVSGGIDSALVASIARPVCDSLKIPLIGRSLPHATNKEDETKRADAIGKYFCTDYAEFKIGPRVDAILADSEVTYSKNEDEKFNKIALGNIKARIRMIHLYDLAGRTKGMVMGTDNLTELLLGFWTLHGDVGDYGLIQNLWKTEVYDLSKWVALEYASSCYDALMDCVRAVPTDGLGITNSDLDQLGASTYDEVDKILKTWLTDDIDSFWWDKDSLGYPKRLEDPTEFFKYRDSLKDHPVIQRHLKSAFKRKNPINVERTKIFKGV